MLGSVPVGCGQCMPCRINRRRVWQSRIVLESLCHERSCFVTLTYNEEHFPDGGSVRPRDVQLWVKRFRKRVSPQRVRFFLVGEYGSDTWRPHYHVMLFGVGMECLPLVEETWRDREKASIGFVHVGECNKDTAGYIAGYTTKKLTRLADPALGGRAPEFARMSSRPGIGADAVLVLAEALSDGFGLEELEVTGDVPMAVKVGGKLKPLGRYLRGKLREEVGFTEEYKEEIVSRFFAEKSSELSDLFLVALSDRSALSAKEALVNLNRGRVAFLEARSKIFQARSKL